MDKRELLELCAKACGRELPNPVLRVTHHRGVAPYLWNPVGNDGDCFRMETQMRVGLTFHEDGVTAMTMEALRGERYADHPDADAARRWASCRAVAATVKS